MLPNTKVPFKEAAIGSAFTGSVWVVFILLFMVYTKAFANSTFAIYGALASIPLFLLMVYASSLIVLYGAEVSYTLMHPEMYTNLYIGMKDRKDIHVYYGVSIIHYIYRKFEDGRRGTTYRELSKLCVYNSEEVDFFVKKFIDEGMIIQDNDLGYIPGNASRNIRLADIVNSVHHISLEIPHGARKSPLKDYMADLFGKMGASRTTIIGDVTLKEVIKKTS
jgi:membrane protein